MPQLKAESDSGMDGLDALMASLSDKPSAGSKKASAKSTEQAQAVSPKHQQAQEMSPRAAHFADALRQFSLDVADPATRQQMNEELAQQKFQDLVSYFVDKPELADYTIKTDLDRMDYTVKTPVESVADEPRLIVDKQQIREFFKKQSMEKKQPSMLWRLANQSVLADVLMALRQHMVMPHDPSGMLSIGIRNESAAFTLDFSDPLCEKLAVECVFNLCTLGCPGQEDVRLALASITGMIHVEMEVPESQPTQEIKIAVGTVKEEHKENDDASVDSLDDDDWGADVWDDNSDNEDEKPKKETEQEEKKQDAQHTIKTLVGKLVQKMGDLQLNVVFDEQLQDSATSLAQQEAAMGNMGGGVPDSGLGADNMAGMPVAGAIHDVLTSTSAVLGSAVAGVSEINLRRSVSKGTGALLDLGNSEMAQELNDNLTKHATELGVGISEVGNKLANTGGSALNAASSSVNVSGDGAAGIGGGYLAAAAMSAISDATKAAQTGGLMGAVGGVSSMFGFGIDSTAEGGGKCDAAVEEGSKRKDTRSLFDGF